jgi:hypothetical protein
MHMKKILLGVIAAIMFVFTLSACEPEADTVSDNLSTDADNFKVQRRIVFFNGITDKYLLQIEGRCSLGNHDSAKMKSVTCKIGPHKYVKHILGLSDNVAWFMEQLESSDVSAYHHKIVFRPQTIIPDIDVRTEGKADEETIDEGADTEGNGVVAPSK